MSACRLADTPDGEAHALKPFRYSAKQRAALQTLGNLREWSMTNVKPKDKADMLEKHNITEARSALACTPSHVQQ